MSDSLVFKWCVFCTCHFLYGWKSLVNSASSIVNSKLYFDKDKNYYFMPDTCFFLFNCKTNCVDSKKKASRVHFSLKPRTNIFKEMISWIANIKELVDFETLDAFKRIGRPRPFFFWLQWFHLEEEFCIKK